MHGRVDLLRIQPKADLHEGTLDRMRPVLWRGRRECDEPGRAPTLRPSCARTVRTARPDTRVGGAHGRDRAAHCLERSTAIGLARGAFENSRRGLTVLARSGTSVFHNTALKR